MIFDSVNTPPPNHHNVGLTSPDPNPANQTQEYDPREMLRLVFGAETAANAAFVGDVARFLRMICEKGVPYALLCL